MTKAPASWPVADDPIDVTTDLLTSLPIRLREAQKVFERTGVEAALAAGVFHRREVPIADVKAHLKARGVDVRA